MTIPFSESSEAFIVQTASIMSIMGDLVLADDPQNPPRPAILIDSPSSSPLLVVLPLLKEKTDYISLISEARLLIPCFRSTRAAWMRDCYRKTDFSNPAPPDEDPTATDSLIASIILPEGPYVAYRDYCFTEKGPQFREEEPILVQADFAVNSKLDVTELILEALVMGPRDDCDELMVKLLTLYGCQAYHWGGDSGEGYELDWEEEEEEDDT